MKKKLNQYNERFRELQIKCYFTVLSLSFSNHNLREREHDEFMSFLFSFPKERTSSFTLRVRFLSD